MTQGTIDPGLEHLAKLLDDKYELFGFRFGLNLIIDIIPVLGDVANTVINLYVFSMVLKYRPPRTVIAKMLFNIGIFFLIDFIPLFGDLFGAWFKPNRRNVNLLRKALAASSHSQPKPL